MNEEAEMGRHDLRRGTVLSLRSEAAPRPCKAETVNEIPRRESRYAGLGCVWLETFSFPFFFYLCLGWAN